MKARPGWLFNYIAALLPAIVTVAWWQWAEWAFDHYGCIDLGKSLQPCFASGVDITGWVGFGRFWCQLLSWACVPLSLYLLIEVRARQSGSYQRYLDRQRRPDRSKPD